jgi:hypothetical protein
MKTDVVSQTCGKIIAIIDKEIAEKDGIEVHLENFMDECKSSKLKLRLHIIHKGVRSSRIVSDCLSRDDIGKIQEIVARDCETRQVKYR